MTKAKPKSLWRFVAEAEDRRLTKRASEAVPRDYFRASELGGCARAVAYDMLGSRPNPGTVKRQLITDMGEAAHHAIQAMYARHTILDGCEGQFNDPSMSNTLQQRLPENVEIFKWVPRVPAERASDCHCVFKHSGRSLEIHFRPDGIIRGIRHSEEEVDEWPPEDWELLEYKSTTDWGVNAARESASDPTRPWGWYPSFVVQAQVQMHLLGLAQARIVQSGRDHPEPISDDYQAEQSKVWSAGKRWHFPEHTWQVIPYDKEFVMGVLDRMVMIKECVDKGELPPPECSGPNTKNFIYNTCAHNAEGTSAAQCRGIQG